MAQDSLIQHSGGVLVADMIVSADTTDDLELTQHAVEDGSTISDHAIFEPTTLELTLVQTDQPLEADGFRKQSADLSYQQRPRGTQQGTADVAQLKVQLSPLGVGNAARGLLSGDSPTIKWTGAKTDGALETKPLSVQVLTADQDVARVNEFHDALLTLRAAVEPLVVTVKGQTLVDMVITSIKRTDPQGQAGCARFTVSMQQIRTVETQTVELPPVPKATAKKSVGKVQYGPPPPPVEERQRTAAHALLFGSDG